MISIVNYSDSLSLVEPKKKKNNIAPFEKQIQYHATNKQKYILYQLCM